MLKIASAALAATTALALTLTAADAAPRRHVEHVRQHHQMMTQSAPYYDNQSHMAQPLIPAPEYFEQAAPDIVGGP